MGHVISKDGVLTDPEKTAKIRDWPIPTSVKELHSFIGFANYYRRFIKDFTNIAAPLEEELKGKQQNVSQKLNWSSNLQDNFKQLKDKLTTAPILKYPNKYDTFILVTDASNFGIGVLSQIN